MLNGKNFKEYDPSNGIEVTEIIPTATGEYLENVRKATQAHIRSCAPCMTEECYDEMYEVLGGSHPYRDSRLVPKEFLHPLNAWFWK